MFKVRLFLLALLAISLSSSEGAKILGLFPFPGPSQYISATSYLKKLAERGHEVTVISQFPQKEKLPNFRDIKIKSEGYENLIKEIVNNNPNQAMISYADFFSEITLLVLDNPQVQDLLHSGKYHFDLVIIETMLLDALYAIGPHFGAHLIGFSTLGSHASIDDLVGNTSPLSYIPLISSPFTDRMNFCERVQNAGLAILEGAFNQLVFKRTNEKIYKKYFSHLPYTLDEINKNFSLVLLNQHYSLSFPRPYVPNMIEVGGLFIEEKVSPLPKNIENFIDGAKDGVIYFSMGSNIKSKYLSPEKRKAILKVFSSLKERVLWKFEDPNLPEKPDNVLISKWFPQTDILAHPKVKLFITHAGLLSTIESIHYAKPVVGIPVFLDQFLNAERCKKMGFGLSLSFQKLNEKDLREAVMEILQNDAYTKAAQKISKRYHDQPMKPLEKAIYWTEYVLRHDGAEFMRVAAQDLNFFQYHSLDTIGFILGIVFILLVIIILVLRCFVKFLYRCFTKGGKRKDD